MIGLRIESDVLPVSPLIGLCKKSAKFGLNLRQKSNLMSSDCEMKQHV